MKQILTPRATSGLGADVALGFLGAATSRHLITTASLLQAIDDQRAEEASNRWAEVSRKFMSEDSDASTSDADRSDAAA